MSLLYNKVQKTNPLDREEPNSWHLALKTTGTLTEKEVAKEIADEITLNPKEAEMAIYQLQKVMIKWLLNNKTITLGELGSFYLTVCTKGVDSKEKVSANQVTKIRLHFRPSKSLREQLAKASFLPIESLLNGE